MIINPYIFGGLDPDAQAFLTAAGITDATITSAINTLTLSLKANNLWTKMKAVYPFVGGTASTHKWNLKDPQDTNAAFRLTFHGGITHNSNGMIAAINGYANTYLTPSTALSQNDTHISYYSRTSQANASACEIGCNPVGNAGGSLILVKWSDGLSYYRVNSGTTYITVANSDSKGFYMSNRTASNVINGWKNSTKVATGTIASNGLSNVALLINAYNDGGSIFYYSLKDCAFATVGNGLNDTEASNLYTIVQTFQTTLGRSVGAQTVSDSDAQAFINAASIDDQVQATAVNTLVTDLKAYGLWTKMYAIYPFVGGSATSHKFNLKNPVDSDAAYRLVFNGGWVHSSTGVLGNGTNTYANTNLGMNILPQNNASLSIYSRTNSIGNRVELGVYYTTIGFYSLLCARLSNNFQTRLNSGATDALIANTDSTGFYQVYRTDATNIINKKGTATPTSFARASVSSGGFTFPYFLGDLNFNSTPLGYYTNREYAFASLGEGYTDSDAANLYTAVQTYQTSLSRQI